MSVSAGHGFASTLVTGLPKQFFADLIARAAARRAAGHDVVNLGQGNPDVPTPAPIVETLAEASRLPEYQRYTPFRGLPDLKRAVATWYARRFGVTVDPASEVAIVLGAKVALGELPLCLLEPGDAVLVPDPCYPDYLSGIALARARLEYLPLSPERGYAPLWDKAPDDARLVYLNYPHNPTGAAADPALFQEAVDWAAQRHCVLVHDWAYGDIRFDGRPSVSLLTTPGAMDVGVELMTLSKSHSMAGWRIAFAVGRADVIANLELLQDHLHCGPFAAIQRAAIRALEPDLDEAVMERCRIYERRRNVFLSAISSTGWHIPPPAGSIFIWCPVPGPMSGQAFADLLLEEADVVVAPGAGFGSSGEKFVRISVTAPEDRLVVAAERIGELLQRHHLVTS